MSHLKIKRRLCIAYKPKPYHKLLSCLPFQAELKKLTESEKAAVGALEANRGYHTDSDLQRLKKKVEEIEGLVKTLSIIQPPAAYQAPTDEFECMICYNLPPKTVYICTECEGTLCKPCQVTYERTHARPLSCPQCKTKFIVSQNPIRSRKMERLIQMMQ